MKTKLFLLYIQDIPGVVYPSDFDMGVLNSAYYDTDVANYQVSTGSYLVVVRDGDGTILTRELVIIGD